MVDSCVGLKQLLHTTTPAPRPPLQIGRLERAVQTAEDACTNTEREAKNEKSNADKEITRLDT